VVIPISAEYEVADLCVEGQSCALDAPGPLPHCTLQRYAGYGRPVCTLIETIRWQRLRSVHKCVVIIPKTGNSLATFCSNFRCSFGRFALTAMNTRKIHTYSCGIFRITIRYISQSGVLSVFQSINQGFNSRWIQPV